MEVRTPTGGAPEKMAFDGNQAIPYLLFGPCHRPEDSEFPSGDFKLVTLEHFCLFAYLLSGGFKPMNLLPEFLYPAVSTFERITSPLWRQPCRSSRFSRTGKERLDLWRRSWTRGFRRKENQRMSNKSSSNIFTRIYNVGAFGGVLETALFKRAFSFLLIFFTSDGTRIRSGRYAKSSPELFEDGDILDIGANIGYTACVFARRESHPRKSMRSSLTPRALRRLEKLFGARKLGDAVEIFNMAVGSADGSLEFWHNEEHSADHRVVTEQFKSVRPAGEKTMMVPVTSVDSFVAARNLRKLSFIKIDVQGYELAVCEGMRKALEKFPQMVIAFEYAPDGMRELGLRAVRVARFFPLGGLSTSHFDARGYKPSGRQSRDRCRLLSARVTSTCFAPRKGSSASGCWQRVPKGPAFSFGFPS